MKGLLGPSQRTIQTDWVILSLNKWFIIFLLKKFNIVCLIRVAWLEIFVSEFIPPPPDICSFNFKRHQYLQFNRIVALLVGGYLCSWTSFDGGWPSIYYLFGVCGIVWTVIMFVLFSDTPSTHRFISQNEKEYIMIKTRNAQFKKNLVICSDFIFSLGLFDWFCFFFLNWKVIPWIKIFTSKACIAIFISHFCMNW